MTDDKDRRIAELEGHLAEMTEAARRYFTASARRGLLGRLLMKAAQSAQEVLENKELRALIVKPVLFSEYPITLADGKTLEMWPLQVFDDPQGGFEIRLGNNLLIFGAAGEWTGGEVAVAELDPNSPENHAQTLGWQRIDTAKDQAPAKAYYQVGSNGWLRETAGWPRRPSGVSH